MIPLCDVPGCTQERYVWWPTGHNDQQHGLCAMHYDEVGQEARRRDQFDNIASLVERVLFLLRQPMGTGEIRGFQVNKEDGRATATVQIADSPEGSTYTVVIREAGDIGRLSQIMGKIYLGQKLDAELLGMRRY